MAGNVDEAAALAAARGFAGLKGMDLAKEVTTALTIIGLNTVGN